MELEYWKYDAGSDSVALLVIPAALGRARTFDLDATLLVQVPQGLEDGWHELMVEVDGRQLWSRRIRSHNPGATDGLDYHHRLNVQADTECRVRAKVACQGSRVHSLVLEARETGYGQGFQT